MGHPFGLRNPFRLYQAAWLACACLFFPSPSLAVEEVTFQRDIPYVDRDGTKLLADVYTPHGEGPFPGVLMIHGGGWMSGSKTTMAMHAYPIAKRGYVVVSINYRLAPMSKFPAQIEDCRDGLLWMRANAAKYKIDPKRIATYGYSAGAHLAALLGANPKAGIRKVKDPLDPKEPKPDTSEQRVQAVIAGGAPVDFQNIPLKSRVFTYFLGGSREQVPELYREASPAAFVTPDDPPMYFFHGDSDLMVPRQSAESMSKDLMKAGVKSQFSLVSNRGHIAALFDLNEPKKCADFLDGVLKK